MTTENVKNEIIGIVFAQKNVIYITTAIFLVVSILIAFFWPRIYSSTTSILVRGKEVEKDPVALDVSYEQIRRAEVTTEDLSSELEILTSLDLIKQTLTDLDGAAIHVTSTAYQKSLDETTSAFFKGEKRSASPQIARRIYQLDENVNKQIYAIRDSLTAEIIPASNVIRVTFLDGDAGFTKLFMESLIANYIQYRETIQHSAQQDFFENQVEKFKGNIEVKNDEMLDMVKASGVTEPQQELAYNLENKSLLERQLDNLSIEAVGKNHLIKSLETALREKNNQFFSFIEKDTLNSMATKLQEEISKRSELLSKYQENAQPIVEIDQRISEIYLQLEKEVRSYIDYQKIELEIIEKKKQSINERLQEINLRNVMYVKSAIAMDMNDQERKLQSFSYETFSKRREESSISDSRGPSLSSISILSNAYPSDGPVFPKKSKVIPFGLISGFFTGISLGFIREYFDRTFKQPLDVKKTLDLPVIFSIPRWDCTCSNDTTEPVNKSVIFQSPHLDRFLCRMKIIFLELRLVFMRLRMSSALSVNKLKCVGDNKKIGWKFYSSNYDGIPDVEDASRL